MNWQQQPPVSTLPLNESNYLPTNNQNGDVLGVLNEGMSNYEPESSVAQVEICTEPPNLTTLRSYNGTGMRSFEYYGKCPSVSSSESFSQQTPMSETMISKNQHVLIKEEFDHVNVQDRHLEKLERKSDKSIFVKDNEIDQQSEIMNGSKKKVNDASTDSHNQSKLDLAQPSPRVAQIFPRTQCFAKGPTYPISEKKISIPSFQIFGFSAQVPQFFHNNQKDMGENASGFSQCYQNRTNCANAQTTFANNDPVPKESYCNLESTTSAVSNNENVPTTMPPCQHPYLGVQMSNPARDVQHLLITKTKTSISVIEYGDVETYQYQQQIFPQGNNCTVSGSSIAPTPVEHGLENSYKQAKSDNLKFQAVNVQNRNSPLTSSSSQTKLKQPLQFENFMPYSSQWNMEDNVMQTGHAFSSTDSYDSNEKKTFHGIEKNDATSMQYFSPALEHPVKSGLGFQQRNHAYSNATSIDNSTDINNFASEVVHHSEPQDGTDVAQNNGVLVAQNKPFLWGQTPVLCGPSCSQVFSNCNSFCSYAPSTVASTGSRYIDRGFSHNQQTSNVPNFWKETYDMRGQQHFSPSMYSNPEPPHEQWYQNSLNYPGNSMKIVAVPEMNLAKSRKSARLTTKKTTGIRKAKSQKNRRFVCTHSNCNKKYFKEAHLEMHLRKHAGERPYSCPWKGCDRSFQRSDQLKRHERRHTGERPYQCETCKRAFARSDHLKTHKKTHIDRPYSCQWEECKKKFALPEELCRHYVTHQQPKSRPGNREKARSNTSLIHHHQPDSSQSTISSEPRSGTVTVDHMVLESSVSAQVGCKQMCI